MARSPSSKKDRDSRSPTPTPATSSRSPSPSPSPSRSSASGTAARNAANAAQARAFQEARAISEQRQRDIQSVRDRTEHTLSRTPAAVRESLVRAIAEIDVEKRLDARRASLRQAAKKLTRKSQLGKLTDKKPARDPRRLSEKVRAILGCKSRPKNKKRSRRGGGGGGLKRFIPWC